jgi:hypothetical protein
MMLLVVAEQAVGELLEQGAKVDVHGRENETALSLAVSGGHRCVARGTGGHLV